MQTATQEDFDDVLKKNNVQTFPDIKTSKTVFETSSFRTDAHTATLMNRGFQPECWPVQPGVATEAMAIGDLYSEFCKTISMYSEKNPSLLFAWRIKPEAKQNSDGTWNARCRFALTDRPNWENVSRITMETSQGHPRCSTRKGEK